MRDETAFDAFYVETRDRLRHQAFALTGDVTASEHGVRDAFVTAWQRWGKVSKLPDPEAWTRPIAWSKAQRHRSSRRAKAALETPAGPILDALDKLTDRQRRTLLLASLASRSADQIAQETGAVVGTVDRELQAGQAIFAAQRGLGAGAFPADLAAAMPPAAWPSPARLRRSGQRQRQFQTVIAVAASVSCFLGAGAITHQGGTDTPALIRPTPSTPPPSLVLANADEPAELNEENLLGAAQVARLSPQRNWTVQKTTAEPAGDSQMFPCQRSASANASNVGILLRTFGSAGKGSTSVSAYQMSELSPTNEAAERTYRIVGSWFAGCDEKRAQLISTERVSGVGAKAILIELRLNQAGRGSAKPTSLLAGVSLTGQITVTTVVSTTDADSTSASTLLAAAVNRLCGMPGAGTCAGPPDLSQMDPLPAVPEAPGMIGLVDLPRVPGVTEAWVGTEPRKAASTPAPTECGRGSFAAPMTQAFDRTFVFPDKAGLPANFGLTETVGTLPDAKAAAFVDNINENVARCAKSNLGTSVDRVTSSSSKNEDLYVWDMTVELSNSRSLAYLLATIRSGTAVAQIGFTSTTKSAISRDDFVALARRAQARLSKMPDPPNSAGAQ
jgi:DNA-directed RNA polymerase specialized sigma24 family protein